MWLLHNELITYAYDITDDKLDEMQSNSNAVLFS